MISYIVRRLIYMVPTVVLISMISFIIIELPPGDYITSYAEQLESRGEPATEDQLESLRKRYGLGQPIYQRYFKWVTAMMRGDFGMSWDWNMPVADLIVERLPYTLLISLTSLVLIYIVAIPIGIYTAVKQYSLGDYFFTVLGFLGLAIPNFLLALVLMFASLSFFDVSIGGLFSPGFQDAPWSLAKIKDLIDHLWVPVIVLGSAGTAGTIRIMRGVLLDELGKDYVRTARAKGLMERRVIFRHPVRIALNPIISLIGFQFPALLSGAAITSIVLNLPTTGPLLLQALETQDMYLAGSLIFLLSILTVVGLFVSDMMLAAIDPRIKFE